MVFGPIPNREYHEGFMREAIGMAEFALASDETPVGCVFVHGGKIIGRGINGTNASLNVSRHPLQRLAAPEMLLAAPLRAAHFTHITPGNPPCRVRGSR